MEYDRNYCVYIKKNYKNLELIINSISYLVQSTVAKRPMFIQPLPPEIKQISSGKVISPAY